MKNTKREVIEKLVPFNRAELACLRRVVDRAKEQLREGNLWDTRPLLDRIIEKLDRASQIRRPR